MKTILLILLLFRHSHGSPTIEDNKIPTDQEILGQPEEVASLGLPSDEESFNHLSVFFTPSKPSSAVNSGTYHFVSSTFPGKIQGQCVMSNQFLRNKLFAQVDTKNPELLLQT